LSKFNESRIIDSSDKMCLLQLEYLCVETTFEYYIRQLQVLTDFFIAEAWVSTRISPSFSSSCQLWFL